MATKKIANKTAAPAEAQKPEELTQVLPTRSKALVFISHDSRDAELAEAFANLLSDVSAGTLKSFRSSDKKGTTGIEFGAEWYTSIMSQLGDATDVVALLSEHSIDRPWILYEAGVARGKLETTVLGLALGVPLEKVSTGPFGQFQNCGDDEDSLTKLVMQLLRRNPDAAPREEAVRRQVQLFIASIKTILKAKAKHVGAKEIAEDQNTAKLFEEVKAMVRELPMRIDERGNLRDRGGSSTKRIRRLEGNAFKELMYAASRESGSEASISALIILTSFLRDEMPWMFELSQGIVRALESGFPASVIKAHKQFRSGMDLMMTGPLGREFSPDDQENYFLLRHLPEAIDRAVFSYLDSVPARRKMRMSKLPSEDPNR